ncbi:hypothetical protein Gotur_023299, partial [Gossypium turneri]
ASKLVLHKDVASSFVAEALACSQAVQLGVNIGLATVIYPKNDDLVAHTIVTESLKRGDEVLNDEEDGDDEKFQKGGGYAYFGTGINNKGNEESRTKSGGQFISD